ncbi:MAG: hypothetical protein JW816_02395 [Candidatus Buchananbacteria bacterium]|nr:hypothetical protein [Candidatus Buchananbacteria bacterium]
MAKTNFVLMIMFCFITVAVFGFLAIGNGGCIAAIASGGVCPSHGDPFNVLNFHSQLFKSFSNSIFELLVISLVIIFLLPQIILLSNLVYRHFLNFYFNFRRQFLASFIFQLIKKIKGWLNLVYYSAAALV